MADNSNIDVTVTSEGDASGIKSFEEELNILTAAMKEAQAATGSMGESFERSASQSEEAGAQTKKGLDDVSTGSKSAMGSFNAFMQVMVAQQALMGVGSGLGATVTAANASQTAIVGLSVASSAFGQDAYAADAAAQELASGGLMTVSQAATGLRNLIATGFDLPQAIQIMQRATDQAAFYRQGTLSVGDAVDGMMEGIKNGNEIMADNAGMTTNLTTLITRQGGAMTDLQNIQNSSTTRQRLFNGIMQDTATSAGNAAKYTATFAGEQQSLGATITQTEEKMGSIVELIGSPLVSALADAIGKHQEFVVAAGLAGGATVALAATVIGAMAAFALAASILGGPVVIAVMAVSALIGGVLYEAIRKVENQIGSTANAFTTGTGNMKSTGGNDLDQTSKKASDLADQLETISENVVKANRDFNESLADIVKTHEDKIADLTKQSDQEKTDFAKAQQQKADDFKQSQDDMATQHQESVDEIQRQLDEETAKGRFADQSKIADLQTRLSQENSDYARSTAEKLQQYNTDTANAKDQSDQKLSDLQTQLNTETAFMQQHAAELQGIRASDALDELQQLQQSHADQLAELDKQRIKAIKASQDTGAGMIAAQNSAIVAGSDPHLLDNVGAAIGKNLTSAIGSAIASSLGQIWQNVKDLGTEAKTYIEILAHYGGGGGSGPNSNSAKFDATWNQYLATGNVNYRASGGDVTAGEPYVTGEQGMELFVPKVSGTIIPHAQTTAMLNNQPAKSGPVVNLTMNNYGNNLTASDIINEAMWGLKLA